LERCGAQPVGIERPGAAGRAIRPGLHIVEGELERHAPGLGAMDAVVIWHVLEHLRDPPAALRAAGEALVPGGLLFVAVPNAASWQARFFGRHWFHLDVPRHLHFLTLEGLGPVLRANGFSVERTGTFQLSQSLFGFVQSVLNAVFPSRPNRLYRLMRQAPGAAGVLELALWSLVALPLVPLAVLEAACAAWAGAGAIRILVARKESGPRAAARC
jgi:SAM-dependent methyltransferase